MHMSTGLSTNMSLPGRLGDPQMTLERDPRADPRMVAVLTALGMGGHAVPAPVTPQSTLQEQRDYIHAAEKGFEELNAVLFDDLPPVKGVQRETLHIKAKDNADLALHVYRPTTRSGGTMPGILHLHGGGMVMLQARGAGYTRWCEELAASGTVVVSVEFRNAAGVLGDHPYPAALNDAAAAFEWFYSNRSTLGVGRIVLQGESGGANLALALAIRAHRDGWADKIAGVYAMAPYVSNAWTEKPAEYPSLRENDGYFIDCSMMAVFATVYDPTADSALDPTCWPINAQPADLEDLPPHVISVNELDPLRDEGLAYYRKLLSAGVDTTGRMVLGTVHTGDLLFRKAIPDVFAATVTDIHRFAERHN